MDKREVLARAMKIKSKPHAMLRFEVPTKERPWSLGESRTVRWQNLGSLLIAKVGDVYARACEYQHPSSPRRAILCDPRRAILCEPRRAILCEPVWCFCIVSAVMMIVIMMVPWSASRQTALLHPL